MSFPTISNTELNAVGATTLPNQPSEQGYSATQLKQKFDEPAKQLIAPKFNNLVSELQATTAANDIGAVTPPNRAAASTVQGVMNNISSDLDGAIGDIANLQVDEHTHTNKALLDTYAQTEADLAQAVADDHTHGNKALLDTYTQTNSDLADAVSNQHIHTNKTELDKIGESGGRPTYNGSDIGGTVNNAFNSIKVGAHTITASGNDSFELEAGSNVTMTVSGNKIKIQSTGGGGGGGGGDMDSSDYCKLGVTDTVDKAVSLYDGDDSLTASIPELNTLDGITASTAELNTLDGITASTSQLNFTQNINVSSPSDGELMTYDNATSKWVNKAPDKSLARYGGSKTFAELTSSLLVAANEDKFYLCTDGGTIAQADQANWILPYGSVIPADSHIAVVNTGTELSPVFQFDDFGGYVDISGKADKTELPVQLSRSSVTVASGSDVRIPSSGTNSAIKTTSKIIPMCDKGDNKPAKFSAVKVYSGYVEITMAEALSSAEVGIVVFNS